MSFGGTVRRGPFRPFDEICSCDHEEAGLVCLCTRTKEQAKDRCGRCSDGVHAMRRNPQPTSFARTEG